MSDATHQQGVNSTAHLIQAVDFTEPAELFSGRTRTSGTGYRRFASLHSAVSFSIEKMPGQELNSVAIETQYARYAAQEIRTLYDRLDFPRGGTAR
jgi:hypothetical protein